MNEGTRNFRNTLTFHRRKPTWLFPLLFLACGTIGNQNSRAETIFWNGSGTAWTTATSWSTSADTPTPNPLVVPGITDDAVFNITSVNAAQAITLGANQVAKSLIFNNTGTTTFTGGGTNRELTVGSGGITLNPGAGAVVIGSTTSGQNTFARFGETQALVNNSAGQLRFANSAAASTDLAGPISLTIAGAGSGTALFSSNLNDGVSPGRSLALVINSTGGSTTLGGLSSTFSGGTYVLSGTLVTAGFGRGPVYLGSAEGSANASLTQTGTSTFDMDIFIRWGTSGNTLTLGNSGNSVFRGELRLDNNLTLSAGAITAIQGLVSGSGSLNKTGASTLLLTANNTFTGALSIGVGTLTVSSLNSVASGSSSSNLGAPTTIANGTISIGSAANSGTLFYIGEGETTDRTLNLAGTTGGAVIDASGSGPLVFNSGVTATGAGAKTITLQGTNMQENVIRGPIVNSTSTTALTKTGPGMWILAGPNTRTGTTSVTGGVLKIDASQGGTLAPTSTLSFGGGTLWLLGNVGGTSQTVGGVTLGAGYATIKVDSNTSGTTTLTMGTLTATTAGGSLNVTTAGDGSSIVKFNSGTTNGLLGNGRLLMNGANWATNSGAATNVTAYSAYTNLATSAGTDTNNSTVTNGATLLGARTTNSLKITETSAEQTLALDVNNLRLTSGGLLYVGGNGYTISGITGTLLSGTATNSDLVVHAYGSGGLTIDAVIANGNGASTLTKTGPGNLTLSRANTFTGPTYFTGGVVSINSNAALGAVATGATVNLNGGTLQATPGSGEIILDNGGANKRAFVLAAKGSSFDVFGSDNLVVTGAVGGSGSLTKNGDGTLTLRGANTYTGGSQINGGLVVAGSTTALGTGNILTFGPSSNATFLLNSNSLGVGGLSGDSSATVQNGGSTANCTLSVSNTYDRTFAGTLSDDGTSKLSVAKGSVGDQTFSGTNTYSGTTTINLGALIVTQLADGGQPSSIGQSPSAAANLVLSGGTLRYIGGSASSNRSFTLNAGLTSTIDIALPTTHFTLSGGSANTTGNFNKVGAGKLTLSGTNLHTGTTTVSEGILALASNVVLSTGGITVNGPAAVLELGYNLPYTAGTVRLADGGTISSSGNTSLTSTVGFELQHGSVNTILAGSGVAVDKSTSGTVTLASVNTYTGQTTIRQGTLRLSPTGWIGSSAQIIIKNGGILDTSSQNYTMRSSQPIKFTLNSGGTGSAGRIHATVLNINTAIVDFESMGTLDDPVYVLADYSSLAGSVFSSVNNLPSGYTIDYRHNNGTQIALVATPKIGTLIQLGSVSTWTLLLVSMLLVRLPRKRFQG